MTWNRKHIKKINFAKFILCMYLYYKLVAAVINNNITFSKLKIIHTPAWMSNPQPMILYFINRYLHIINKSWDYLNFFLNWNIKIHTTIEGSVVCACKEDLRAFTQDICTHWLSNSTKSLYIRPDDPDFLPRYQSQ